MKVTVLWADHEFKFTETLSSVDAPDIARNLSAVYLRNKGLWENSDNQQQRFSYPISEGYLSQHFNRGVQVDSGQSVVIISEADQKVFKKSMSSKDENQMWRLRGQSYPQVAFPIDVRRILNVYFFSFALYSGPPTVETIRQYCEWYTRSLVSALKGLHDGPKLAHLDIRRENVCMDLISEPPLIVLIDLDRSCECEKPALAATALYTTATDEMYKPLNSTWTCENLDWLQLGLLLCKVFTSHVNDSFICELKNGECIVGKCTHV